MTAYDEIISEESLDDLQAKLLRLLGLSEPKQKPLVYDQPALPPLTPEQLAAKAAELETLYHQIRPIKQQIKELTALLDGEGEDEGLEKKAKSLYMELKEAGYPHLPSYMRANERKTWQYSPHAMIILCRTFYPEAITESIDHKVLDQLEEEDMLGWAGKYLKRQINTYASWNPGALD